jgi:hypothetical protein
VRHTSRRRTFVDPLLPQPSITWLVARDATGRILEQQELAAGTDPKPVLAAAREARSDNGWVIEPMGPASSGFFCSRAGERLHVGIERVEPGRPLLR